MKNVRALSFMRNERSEKSNIFVLHQKMFSRFLSLPIIKTLNCVNNKYVPMITTIITGIITIKTSNPFAYKAVKYPVPSNNTAMIVNKIDAFGSPFDCLSPLINSISFLLRKIKATKNEMNKNKRINETNVTTMASNGK